jgi:hypothetical protein
VKEALSRIRMWIDQRKPAIWIVLLFVSLFIGALLVKLANETEDLPWN